MWKQRVCTAFFALSSLVTATAAEIEMRSTDIPPRIDGVLDDACWKEAAEIPINHVIGSEAISDRHKAFLTRDDKYLYVAYDIRHPARNRVPCEFIKGLDDSVQRDDCVKLSFDPGTDGKLWYHFKINRANVRQDRRFADGKMEIAEFNIPWRSATRENDENWTAEIAVPLCLLYPFEHPEKARINVSTTTFTQERDPMGVAQGQPKRTPFSAAPLAVGFTETNKFIPLKGLDFLTVKAPFLPFVEKVNVTEYFKKDGRYHYGVDILLKSCAAPAGKVELSLTDKTGDGREKNIRETISIPANAGEKNYRLAIAVDSLIKRAASLKMIAPESGEVLQEIRFREEDMRSLDLMSAYASRNYYASDRVAVAVCEIRLPKEELASMTLSAVNAKGETLATLSAPAAKSELNIPVEKLTMDAANPIDIRLADNQGRAVSSIGVEFIRRAPKPGREWQIDHVNRVVLNNGAPFFGMGFVCHRINSESEKDLERIAAAGFNFIMRWKKLYTQEEWARFLALAEKHGLYVLPAIDDISCDQKTELKTLETYFKGKELARLARLTKSSPAGYTDLKAKLFIDATLNSLPNSAKVAIFKEFCDKNAPLVKSAVETAMNSKALLGYFIFDEPGLVDQWKRGAELRDMINETDGYHPVTVNFAGEIPDQPEWLSWFDVIMNDPYWSPAAEYRNSPDYVSKTTDYTYRRGAALRQPTWIVPVATMWSGTRKRILTAAEQSCQAYLAAINGATSMMYFTYENINDQSTWGAVSEMARQFKVLGPMFTAPKPEQKTAYFVGEKEISVDPMNGKIPDIQFTTLRSPEGGLVLVAASCRYYPVKATVKIAGLSGTVGRYFDDKTYPVADGAFSDAFEPFGVRAYKLPADFSASPVEMEIQLVPPAQIPPQERALENSCRQEKKNLFPNPSFEETSSLGWPDYYMCAFFGPRMGPMIGEKGAVWGADDSVSKFGKKSLRISRPFVNGDSPARVLWKCAPKFRENTPCVFSAWLKGSKNGLKVSMSCGAFGGDVTKTFVVTDQWALYEFPGTFKAFAPTHTLFDIRLLDDGALWIDGLQLEKGDKATAFEE